MRRDHDFVTRSAVAKRRLGLGIAFDVRVCNFKRIVAKPAECVAAHGARAGGRRGSVEQQIHAPIVIEIGDKDLLRVCKLKAPVITSVAREARVRCVGKTSICNACGKFKSFGHNVAVIAFFQRLPRPAINAHVSSGIRSDNVRFGVAIDKCDFDVRRPGVSKCRYAIRKGTIVDRAFAFVSNDGLLKLVNCCS